MSSVSQIALLIGLLTIICGHSGRRVGNFLMNSLRFLILMLLIRETGSLNPNNIILKEIPKTIETVIRSFHLHSQSVTYVVCPQCHLLYPPTTASHPNTSPYPKLCSFVLPQDGLTCGRELRSGITPFKEFTMYSVQQWISGIVSLHKAIMDWSSKRIAASSAHSHLPNNYSMHDISNGRFVREFMFTNGKNFFDGGDEGRYGVVFHYDQFNPRGLTIRGETYSAGVLTMACINLPPTVRYNQECIFPIGIIEGPYDVSNEQITHYIDLIVDILLSSWTNGIYLSRTPSFPNGRCVRLGLICTIIDLPATRKAIGLAGHSSRHLCSICPLKSCSNL
jgi:hypothetical protein